LSLTILIRQADDKSPVNDDDRTIAADDKSSAWRASSRRTTDGVRVLDRGDFIE
jgi:hypothetical protein